MVSEDVPHKMQRVELRPKPVEPTVRVREMGSEEEKTKRSRGEATGDDGRPGQQNRVERSVVSCRAVSCHERCVEGHVTS